MISHRQKFKVGKMEVDVNWSKEVTPCKLIRFKFDGKTEIIERDELYSLLFLFGTDAQQDELLPNKRKEMVLIERMLHIKLKKDMKAGELMNVPYQYSLTAEGYEEELKKNPLSFRKLSPEDLQKKQGVI